MASELGRGAQVRLDGDVRQLARGGVAQRLIDNIREKLEMEEAGTAPTGNNADGSLADGTAADDEVLVPGGAEAIFNFTAGGTGAVTRTVQAKQRERVSVLDYIPVAYHAAIAARTSTVDMTTYFQAAIDAVYAAGGGVVEVPAGRYTKLYSSADIFLKNGVRVVGSGRRATEIRFDDPVAGSHACFSFTNATGASLEHLRVSASSLGSLTTQHLIYGLDVTDCAVRHCRVEYSGQFGIVFTRGDRVEITENEVYFCRGDGIHIDDIQNVLIHGNVVRNCNDDAIACHINDATSAPIRSGVVISDNRVTESQGIVVLGAKSATITGNVLRRIMTRGIVCVADTFATQGATAHHSVIISNNVINDVWLRPESTPINHASVYMNIGGGVRQKGLLASVPGEPDPTTGLATDAFGTGTSGYFYANNTDAAGAASPGNYWFQVTNNVLARTLPAVTAYSQWGYGSSLNVGRGNGNAPYSGAFAETDLQIDGIWIDGPLRNSRIAGNIIQTTGNYGIFFRGTPSAGDFDGLIVEHNLIADFNSYGAFMATGTHQRVQFLDNRIDGDPRHRHSARAADGTWATDAGPAGLYIWTSQGPRVARNWFRNLGNPLVWQVLVTNSANIQHNVIACNPAVAGSGFSATNGGVSILYPAGEDWSYEIEDCNPTSATFGRLLNATLVTSTAAPTAGTYVRGHFVRKAFPTVSAGKVLLGWVRLTTGTAHVDGTDWSPFYGTTS